MPVQVFTSSPITASKASGVTPKTDAPEDVGSPLRPPRTTTRSSPSQQAYPPAQPGARPSLPVQTGAPRPFTTQYQPTPSQTDSSPPPPQPGAVPTPAGGSRLPPPPKAGESKQQPPQITSMPMPPQMSFSPPTSTYPTQGGSSITSTQYSLPGPKLTFLGGDDDQSSFSHPPGYQQNAHAAEFSSYQRAAHNASASQGASQGNDEDSVWNTAKKWAAAAGDSLAAAENEVWKRINKE